MSDKTITGPLEKVWMINIQGCPKELKDEIYEKIYPACSTGNPSIGMTSIEDLKENDVEDSCPILLKYLESCGLNEDETVFIYIWW